MVGRYRLGTILIAWVSLLLLWLPFGVKLDSLAGIKFGKVGFERIVQNFDGLNFLIVAKTGYDPILIETNYEEILAQRKPLYFAAHYPLWPVIIRLFDTFTTGPRALLISIVAVNGLLAWILFEFFRQGLKNPSQAMWLAVVALFWPARMLADRAVGSNEPLFMVLILGSLILAKNGRHWWAGIVGALAVLTRSPAIILFAAYGLMAGIPKSSLLDKLKRVLPYLTMPTVLLLLWMYYGFRFGSFWAYFQVGGNLNLYWPFAVFASGLPWTGGMWMEDIVYLLAFYGIGVWAYVKRRGWNALSMFGVLYLIFTLLVAHRDMSRYMLPISPIAILGWTEVISFKPLRWLLVALLIPIFLFAWQFVIANYQPVSDWTNFL